MEVQEEWYQGATLESILYLNSREDKAATSQIEWSYIIIIPFRIMFFLLTHTNFFGVQFDRRDIHDVDIVNFMSQDSDFIFVGRLIMKLLYIICRNSYKVRVLFFFVLLYFYKYFLVIEINYLQSTELTEHHMKECGTVVGGLISLLNHSCYPNTFLQFKRDCLVMHATVPIKKGEQVKKACYASELANFTVLQNLIVFQIFSCYCYPCSEEEKSVRQQHLEKNFYFKCNCIACVKDWPVHNKDKEKHIKVFLHF